MKDIKSRQTRRNLRCDDCHRSHCILAVRDLGPRPG